MRWLWRAQSDQRGASSIEYIGAVVVVVAVVAALTLASTGVGRAVAQGIETAVCAVLDRCAAPTLVARPAPTAPGVNPLPPPIAQTVTAPAQPDAPTVDAFGQPVIILPDGASAPVSGGQVLDPQTGQPLEVRPHPQTGQPEIVHPDGTSTPLTPQQVAIIDGTIPGTGTPGSAAPGSGAEPGGGGPDGGQPGSGNPGSGSPDGGAPGSGAPGDGGAPGSGAPGSGTPGSGGEPGSGEPGSGAPGDGSGPGSGQPGSGEPGSGDGPGGGGPGSGAPGDGSGPGSGQPGSGEPGSGEPGGGAGPGAPGSGQGPTGADVPDLTTGVDAPQGNGGPESGSGNGPGLPGGANPDQPHSNDMPAGDPVNTRTGAFVTAGTDLSLPGPGLPLELRRSYSSTQRRVGPLGRGWTHSYDLAIERDASGRLLVRNETGFLVPFEVDAETGAISAPPGITSELARVEGGYELTRRDGTVISFDSAGRATALTDRNGLATELEYDRSNRLISVTDAVGRRLSLDWDGNHLVGARLPDGRSVSYRYEDGLLVEVTDVRGTSERYSYDEQGRIVEVVDNNGNLVVRHAYDQNHRVVSQVNGLGHRYGFSYHEDGPFDVTIYTDPRGNRSAFVYAGDRLVRTRDPLGNEVTLRYDDDLNPVEVVDARGHRHRMRYDDRGNLTQVRAPEPVESVTTLRWGPFANLLQMVDGEGDVTELTYDDSGNLLSITDANGATTTLDYDHDLPGLATAITNPAGGTVSLDYDRQGQLISATGPEGARIALEWDERGNVTGFVDPEGFAPGNDPEDYRWSFDWDDAARLTQVTDPLGAVTALTYDAMSNVTSVTDPNGNRTVYEYDPRHRLTAVIAPDGTATRYHWDATDRLIQRTSATGEITRYGYDAAGRLVGVVSPANQRWIYEHDADGNVVTIITPEGIEADDGRTGRLEADYDPLSRLVELRPSDAPTVRFEWDRANRLVEVIDDLGSERYDYDAVGRLIEVARDSTRLSYSYDPVGNLVERDLDGVSTTYTYDAANQLVAVQGDDHGARYRYDQAGRLIEAVMGNGARTFARWDAAGRISKITSIASDGTLMAAASYVLDPAGNPLQVRGIEETTTHVYDQLDRLVQSTTTARASGEQLAQWTYQYDEVGRRVAQRGPEGVTLLRYAVGDMLREVEHPDGNVTTYQHDANGRLVAAGESTFAYDVLDRLVEQTVDGVVTTFAFDGLGRRALERTGAQERSYLWDPLVPNAQLAALRSSDGDEQRFTLLPGGGTLGTAVQGGSAYLHADALGSLIAASGPDGLPQLRLSYTPFGEERTTEPLTDSALPMPLRFTGQLLDEGSGNYHLRLRQLDPALGQMTSLDPAGAFANRPYSSSYGYVDNRPTVWTDPSGACPWCIAGAIGAIGGAIIGGGTEIIKGLASGEGVDWGDVGRAAVGGAIVGGLAGLTMGVGSVVAAGGSAAGYGMVANGLFRVGATLHSFGLAGSVGVSTITDIGLQVWANGGFDGYNPLQTLFAGVGAPLFGHGMGRLLTVGMGSVRPSLGMELGWGLYNSFKYETLVMIPFVALTRPGSAARS